MLLFNSYLSLTKDDENRRMRRALQKRESGKRVATDLSKKLSRSENRMSEYALYAMQNYKLVYWMTVEMPVSGLCLFSSTFRKARIFTRDALQHSSSWPKHINMIK